MKLKIFNYFFCLSLAYLLCGCRTYYINRDIYNVKAVLADSQKIDLLTRRLKGFESYNRNKKLNPKFIILRSGEKYWQLDSIRFDYEAKKVNGTIKNIDTQTILKYEDYRIRKRRKKYYKNKAEKHIAIGQTHFYINQSEINEGNYTINFSEIIRVEDFKRHGRANFNHNVVPYLAASGVGFFIFYKLVIGFSDQAWP